MCPKNWNSVWLLSLVGSVIIARWVDLLAKELTHSGAPWQTNILRNIPRHSSPIGAHYQTIKETNLALPFWDQKVAEIDYMLKHDFIENFLQWEAITSTMYPPTTYADGRVNENTVKQAEWLRRQNVDISWMRESPVGNPLPYYEFSANFVQQISQLVLAQKMLGDLNKFHTIVEFGGGFGSFYRVFRLFGFQQPYYIYDLLQLNTLQRYYVEKAALKSPTITCNEGDVPHGNGILLISMFALAETDNEEKKRWLDRNPNYFVSYCPSFEGVVNNDEWFNNYLATKDHLLRKNFLDSMARFVARQQ